jgi:hypothetical protein
MSEEIEKEKPPPIDRETYLAEIERLYLAGLKTRQIARKMGRPGLNVGRNLREIKNRWARAAARQRAALSQTQCAAVFREAMQGWFRSQQPKTTTTKQTSTGNATVKTTTRCAEGPGDKTFLMAAVAALKALRQFDQPQGKQDDVGDEVYLAILQTMTPEQVDHLKHEELQRIRLAVDRFRAEVDAFRKEAAERNGDPAGLDSPDQAGLPQEPAPPDAGGDAGPGGAEGVPPGNGLDAAAVQQERAGERPLSAPHAGQQPGPAADRGQTHP